MDEVLAPGLPSWTVDADFSIDVIMTCYNEGKYIQAAVRSVLNQTLAGQIASIVIADDGSDPDTVAILRSIESWDSRVQVIYGSGGRGISNQRNLAIGMTSAPLIALLDGDDIWLPDKLSLQVAALKEQAAVGLVYTDFSVFPGEDQALARRAGVLDITKKPDLLVTYFLNDPPIIPSTVLMRRACYLLAGGFDASVKVFEDTDFYLRLAQVCRFAVVNRSLLLKRLHPASITGNRKDLLGHHALVAFKAASTQPALLPLVPQRLSERARKLGNQSFLSGDRLQAIRYLRLAVRLHRLNGRAWTSLIAAQFFPGLAMQLLGENGRKRRSSLGVS